jgi:hypothetical protein
MKRVILSIFAASAVFASAPVQAAEVPHSQFTISSAISVDSSNHTATLPLYRGIEQGETVWYIITDASDASVAKHFGVNYAPSLAKIGDAATQRATKDPGGTYTFEGAPNFSAARTYVASASGFPPASATPGGKGDSEYSPFVRAEGFAGVLNAPIVAIGDGTFDLTTHANTEDRVVAIDTSKHTVTLVLARGFFNDRPVLYLSTDASDPVASSVERAIYAPRLSKASAEAEVPIGVVVNGPQTGDAPQGLAYLTLHTPLSSAATPENAATIGSPFNVLASAPELANPYADNGYSPLWNAVVVGTPQKSRLTNYAQIAAQGKDAGFVVNCPVVAYGQ